MKKGLKLFFTGNYKSRYPLETPVIAGGGCSHRYRYVYHKYTHCYGLFLYCPCHADPSYSEHCQCYLLHTNEQGRTGA